MSYSKLIKSLVALFLLSGCNLQYRMLYYPSRELPASGRVEAAGLRFWPSSSEKYRGLVGGNNRTGAKGTFVIFHGNGGTAVDRSFYADSLGILGYRVLLAEYPAYGGRRGELGEESFVNDGCETVKSAYQAFGKPLFILGESLGAGVAAAVAARCSIPVDGLVLMTPWESLRSVANHNHPFLPVGLFLKDKYDTSLNISSFHGPVAIIGAARDEVIPVSQAQDLYRKRASHAVRLWLIEGAGHNDWTSFVDSEWWNEVTGFIDKRK